MRSHDDLRRTGNPSARPRRGSFRPGRRPAVALATALFLISLSLHAVALGQTAPSISSDKEDYAPGEVVTLTGAGWQPGEVVHIRVDDDQERTWSHDADVTADDAGGFTYRFTLPTHFVAVYTVVATGELSGTATTSFTDGTVEVRNHSTTPSGVTADYKIERWTNTTCTGTPAETLTFSITGPGAASPAGQVSTGNSESIKVTLVSVTGGTFQKWMRDASPPLNESGAVDFSYTSGTCLGVSSPTQWLIFGVFEAANQAPVASDVSVTTNEDTPVTVQLSATDADGNNLTFAIGSGPTNGTLGPVGSVSCSGTAPKTCTANVTYTPNANFHGTDTFTYRANDGTANSNLATVTITVSSVNDAPVANDDSYSTPEDTTLTVSAPGVLGNDTDVENDSLTAVLVSGPSHGTLTLNADGSFTYTPNANFHGTDTFTYRANDGTANSNLATVTITVSSANDAPVANDDSYSTPEDTPLTVDAPGVLGNDTDVDGDPLTVATPRPASGPSHGTLTLNEDGSFTYTPDENYCGTDTFTYKATDGTAVSGEASVTITVECVNDAPVANDDSYSTPEDTALNVDAPGVLDNDTDADGDTLSVTAGSPLDGPDHGTLILNADGSFTYTPDENYCGTDTFTYKATDGTAASGEATVTITVECVNDPPAVSTILGPNPVNESTSEDRNYTFTITDPDSTSFTFVSGYPDCGVNGTVQGTPEISGNSGSFDCRFSDGPAQSILAVKVTDGADASNESTALITILNVPPTVTLTGDDTADEGETKTYSFTTSDPGDPEVFSFGTGSPSCGTGGTLVPGSASIDPDTGAGSFDCKFPDGPASPEVSVTVSDGDGGSGTDSIEVTVANVAPEITSASFNAASVSCSANTVTLTVTFTDPGDDTWLATINWGDESPVESLSVTPGTFTANHTYALAGRYTAQVTVADDDGGSDTEKELEITVNYTIVGGGFLPPINNTGHGQNPSIFKYGSTIPVKIKVQDCNGTYPSTLAPKVYIQKMNGGTPAGGEEEPYSTSAADTGNTMRFTGAPDLQYIYNLATKSFSSDPTSTWQLIVKIPATDQEIKTLIGLRK